MSNRHYEGHETTLVPGTLRGFREWIYEPRLEPPFRSIGHQVRWPIELEASCAVRLCSFECPDCERMHQAPVAGCTCGIYALYEPGVENDSSWHKRVWGVIEASGRILMGTRGFRAQRARMVAVTLPKFSSQKKIQKQYDGLKIFTSYRAMLKAYPTQDLTGIVDLEAMRAEEAAAAKRAWEEVFEIRRAQIETAARIGADVTSLMADFIKLETDRKRWPGA